MHCGITYYSIINLHFYEINITKSGFIGVFLISIELTSKENLNIEAKCGRKRKFVETLTNTSIYILNEMVKSISEMTSESEIDQLYENIEDFMQGNKEEVENEQFLKLHEKLHEKKNHIICKFKQAKSNEYLSKVLQIQ